MRVFWALGFLVLTSGACNAAESALPDYSDIIVVSVVPRSQSVQPIVMSIPASQRSDQAALLKQKPSDARR